MIPPMMSSMMAPRPKNMYLIHGWKVSDAVRNSLMMDKGADAKDLGITLTITANGKDTFMGRLLGTLDVREQIEFTGCSMPGPHDYEDLMVIAEKLGLKQDEMPGLWAVAG